MKAISQAFLQLFALLAVLLGLQILTMPLAYAGATEWVDMKIDNGHLFIETEIAGIKGYALIDTGAQANFINGRFLETTNLDVDKGGTTEIIGVFGAERHDIYKEVPVNIFGTTINFRNIVDTDLARPDIQMVLGAPFLESLIFQFDYPNHRLRLITRDSIDLKKVKNVDTKRDRRRGLLLVKVGLGRKTGDWLVLDTGANGGILISRDLARKLGWLDSSERINSTMSGVHASGDMEYFTVPGIVFGPVELADVPVAIPAPGQSLTLLEEYVPSGTRIARVGDTKGLLGYDVLKHFVVTIDYKTGYVHVQVGEKLTPGTE